jgi:gliding motility-associated-like protein
LPDFIPEGFSPNWDRVNDIFKIEGLNLTDQYVDLSIVNGAGKEVFSTSNHNGKTLTDTWTDWDGKNSKEQDLPEGTYYYMLKITPVGGKALPPTSGFIVLKRY